MEGWEVAVQPAGGWIDWVSEQPGYYIAKRPCRRLGGRVKTPRTRNERRLRGDLFPSYWHRRLSKVGKKGPLEKEPLQRRTGRGALSSGPLLNETLVVLLADSAAEEAGLQVGDVVLAVNGTEVTAVEHAEAVHLARRGRWSAESSVTLTRQRSELQQGIQTWGGGNPQNGCSVASHLRPPLLPARQCDLSEAESRVCPTFLPHGWPVTKVKSANGSEKNVLCLSPIHLLKLLAMKKYHDKNSFTGSLFSFSPSFLLPSFLFFFLSFFSLIPSVFRIKSLGVFML